MESQMLFNALFGLVMVGSGWFLNELWRAVKELRKDLHVLEVNSVSRTEFTEAIRRVEDLCGKIFDRIEDLKK